MEELAGVMLVFWLIGLVVGLLYLILPFIILSILKQTKETNLMLKSLKFEINKINNNFEHIKLAFPNLPEPPVQDLGICVKCVHLQSDKETGELRCVIGRNGPGLVECIKLLPIKASNTNSTNGADFATCPYCNIQLDVSKIKRGSPVRCSKCDKSFTRGD